MHLPLPEPATGTVCEPAGASVVLVRARAAVVARGVHHPAHEDRDEHEGDECADQGPEHGDDLYRKGRHGACTPIIGRPASGVQSDLFLRRRERPRNLHPPLLTEDEAQLLGRPKPVRVRRAERAARTFLGHGAKQVLVEEAVFAARLHACATSMCHTWFRLSLLFSDLRRRSIKADFAPAGQSRIPENGILSEKPKSLQTAGFLCGHRESSRIFRSFVVRWPTTIT